MSGEGAELAGAARATIKSTGAVASTTPDDDAHGSGDDSPGTLARLGAELNGAGAGASSPGVAFADTHEARKASRVGRRVNRLGDTGDAGAGSSSMRQISRSSRHSRASRGPGGRVTKEPFDSSLLRASIASHHKIGSDRQFTVSALRLCFARQDSWRCPATPCMACRGVRWVCAPAAALTEFVPLPATRVPLQSYAITVKYKDNSWIVNRRYSQFLDLHTQVGAAVALFTNHTHTRTPPCFRSLSRWVLCSLTAVSGAQRACAPAPSQDAERQPQ